jgi:cation diffusion facilitator family transporter
MTLSKTLSNDKLVLRATYYAMAVSGVLAILKFTNYFITGSMAIQASALDSLMDVAVSFANFIAIKLVQRKSNSRFPAGSDKIAALFALLQVVFICFLGAHLVHECIEKLQSYNHVQSFGYGFAILVFAIILNMFLVTFQSNVVRKTNSLVIKADMLHYKTDFFSNIALLSGMLAIWMFQIHWLDPVLGILCAVYLFGSVYGLLKTSIASLLDMNDGKMQTEILNLLKKNNFDIDSQDLCVLFSGTKYVVKIAITKDLAFNEIRNVIYSIYPNSKIEFTLKK